MMTMMRRGNTVKHEDENIGRKQNNRAYYNRLAILYSSLKTLENDESV